MGIRNKTETPVPVKTAVGAIKIAFPLIFRVSPIS
jgi:hypothetical protein